MPHIHEGDLHAWLDGAIFSDSVEGRDLVAHLEACPRCQERLAAARRLIGEAAGVLRQADPSPRAAPALESLHAAAASRQGASGSPGGGPAGRSRTRTGWRSLERLAWAASVVLAVGAGWIGRELLVERGWTDPFHVTPPAEPVELDDSAGMPRPVPETGASLEAAGESAPARTAPSPVDARVGETAGREAFEVRDGVEELEGEERPVDGLAAAAPVPQAERAAVAQEPGRRDVAQRPHAKSAGALLSVPPDRRDVLPSDPDGCYSVEAADVGDSRLPEVIEIRRSGAEIDHDSGAAATLVMRGGDGDAGPFGGSWIPFAEDSVWLSLETPGVAATMRLGPAADGDGWQGEAEWSDGGVPDGRRSGAVRLIPVVCRGGDR